MKRGLLIAGVAALVITAGIGFMRWANQPASTSRSNTSVQNPNGVLGSSNSVTPFTSPYFSTQIPTDMQQKTSNENPRGPILATYLFTNVKPSLSDQVAITVATMGHNSLSEISGVKLRTNASGAYEATTVANAPDGALSFKKTEGYETAVFWQEGDKYVAVVVSGPPQRQPELDQTLQTILGNWSWH